MIKLFIAEKPSVAKAIIAELGSKSRSDGYVETKSGDLVTWCFGHLMELAGPDEYLSDDLPKTKSGNKIWREEDLPIIPKYWHLYPKKDCKKQFKIIGQLLKKCTHVVNAGDPDREGQCLVDEVLNYYKNTKPTLRFWVSAQDSQSIQKGLASLKDNKAFIGMYQASLGRSHADWLIGMNFTRAFTLAARKSGSKALLTVGRVQTPTLNLVAKRDTSIYNFKPLSFFLFKANCIANKINFSANLKYGDKQEGLDENRRLVDVNIAKSILEDLKAIKQANVIKAQTQIKEQEQPKAFSLADLQLEANKRFSLSAQKTLDICQSLYEKHKLTSYPRTDCSYLPKSQHNEAKKVLSALKQVNPDLSSVIDKCDTSIMSPTFNDKKITAHHGIVPTMQVTSKADLSQDELNVYMLIVKRYLAQFFGKCKIAQTSIELQAGKYKFTANGNVTLEQGFKEVFDEIKDTDNNDLREDDQKLPKLSEGDSVSILSINSKQDKTKPPAHFTEGTLIRAMENIHTVVDDQKYKKFLKDGDGIGTSATRATIIDELKRKGYLVLQGKKLKATDLAHQFLAKLPDIVKNPVLTAMFEAKLRDVEIGKMTLDSFEKEQQAFIAQQVPKILQTKVIIKE